MERPLGCCPILEDLIRCACFILRAFDHHHRRKWGACCPTNKLQPPLDESYFSCRIGIFPVLTIPDVAMPPSRICPCGKEEHPFVEFTVFLYPSHKLSDFTVWGVEPDDLMLWSIGKSVWVSSSRPKPPRALVVCCGSCSIQGEVELFIKPLEEVVGSFPLIGGVREDNL